MFINFVQKHRRVLWAQSHLRWTQRQWKCVLWSDESTFHLVFLKKDKAKDEKDHPTKSAKTSFCDGIVVHQCPQYGRSAYMLKEPLLRRLMLEYAALKTITFPRNSVHFSRTMPSLILHKLQQRHFVGIACVCLTGVPECRFVPY